MKSVFYIVPLTKQHGSLTKRENFCRWKPAYEFSREFPCFVLWHHRKAASRFVRVSVLYIFSDRPAERPHSPSEFHLVKKLRNSKSLSNSLFRFFSRQTQNSKNDHAEESVQQFRGIHAASWRLQCGPIAIHWSSTRNSGNHCGSIRVTHRTKKTEWIFWRRWAPFVYLHCEFLSRSLQLTLFAYTVFFVIFTDFTYRSCPKIVAASKSKRSAKVVANFTTCSIPVQFTKCLHQIL